jgi:hypothetical protein
MSDDEAASEEGEDGETLITNDAEIPMEEAPADSQTDEVSDEEE